MLSHNKFDKIIYKLEGVAPLIKDPPPTSSPFLSEEEQEKRKKIQVACDT